MSDTTFHMSLDGGASALAVILGTNEIASAVAVQLARQCHHVILCHDPFPLVIRRGMAFHDALFEDLSRLTASQAFAPRPPPEFRRSWRFRDRSR